MPDALDIAERTYVDVNIHDAQNAERLAQLASLPDSCVASAACLEQQRAYYEAADIFSPKMIDGIIHQLRAFADTTLRADIANDTAKEQALVERFFHCG